MEVTDVLQALFRWLHIIAGIIWVGLLYFFNWVNGAHMATLDSGIKKRGLFWFRWGAAYTWLTGFLLLGLVFYHGKILFADPIAGWSAAGGIMVLLSFLGVFIYDFIFKSSLALKKPRSAAIIGFILITVFVLAASRWAGFSYRGYVIHTGVLFGTIMAFNVWFRIWPAQQKILAASEQGKAPSSQDATLAMTRSRHNTYLSIPLIWTMVNAHTTFAANSEWILLIIILIGWHAATRFYRLGAKIK